MAHSSPGSSSRDQVIRALAELMAGLAVPMSMPRGAMAQVILDPITEPWSTAHSALVGVGWAAADQYEAKLREVLDGPAVDQQQ